MPIFAVVCSYVRICIFSLFYIVSHWTSLHFGLLAAENNQFEDVRNVMLVTESNGHVHFFLTSSNCDNNLQVF